MELTRYEDWAKQLGLLPVPLRGPQHGAGTYVLLNGEAGNFCLDVTGSAPEGPHPKSLAWSANCGHHVMVNGPEIVVQRWDQPQGAIERYKLDSVKARLEEFHAYLEQRRPADELSVVSHTIRVFRRLRNAFTGPTSGETSLQGFLLLLACGFEDKHPRDVDAARWGLAADSSEFAAAIGHHWGSLLDELRAGPAALSDLRLDLELLLRHASGELFQEAHYEALLDAQLQLPIAPPRAVVLSKTSVGTGLHFTPAPLARSLVEQCLATLTRDVNQKITIFDPACGSGEFLREALRQLLLRKHAGPIRLVGWDISSAAITMATFALAWDTRGLGKQVELDLHQVDSLEPGRQWPSDVDLLVMNPPFVSWEAMTVSQREQVRSDLGDYFKHRPDLASVFLLKAAQSLGQGTVLGCILPASFLNSESMSGLRARLGELLSPRLLARLGSHLLFPSALIDTGLYIGSRGVRSVSASTAVWVDHRASSTFSALRALRKLSQSPASNSRPELGDGWSIYTNPELGRGGGSWAPRSYKSWRILRDSQLPKVGELFHVRQGVRTGNNKAFLLREADWRELPEREREYFRPAVVNAAVSDGRLLRNTLVFYPYGDRGIASESQLAQRVPQFLNRYLKPNKSALQKRARMDPQRWWELMWPRPWNVECEPRLVSTFFGDRGSFAWDASGEFVVVQGYAWLPKRRKTLPRKVALSYVALLNSRFFEMLLAGVSNHVSGGQWDLATRFVVELRLPDFLGRGDTSGVVEGLAELGEGIHGGGLSALSPAQLRELEGYAETAYEA